MPATEPNKTFKSRMTSMWGKVNGLNKDLGVNVFLYITGPFGVHYYKSHPNFPEGFHIGEGEGRGPEDFMTATELKAYLRKQEAESAPTMPPGFEYLTQYNLMGGSHTSAPSQDVQEPSFMQPLSPFSTQPPLEYNAYPSQIAPSIAAKVPSLSFSASMPPPLNLPRLSTSPPASPPASPPPSLLDVQAPASMPPQSSRSPPSMPPTPPHTLASSPHGSPPPTPAHTPPSLTPSRRSHASSKKLRITPRSTKGKSPPALRRLRTRGLQALAEAATAASPLSPPLPSDTDSDNDGIDSDSESSNSNSPSPICSPVTKKRPARSQGGASVKRRPKFSGHRLRAPKKV